MTPIASAQAIPVLLAVAVAAGASLALRRDAHAWGIMSAQTLAAFACLFGHEPRLAWALCASALFDMAAALKPERTWPAAYAAARTILVSAAAFPLGPAATGAALAWAAAAALARSVPGLVASKTAAAAAALAFTAFLHATGHHGAIAAPVILADIFAAWAVWRVRAIGHVDRRIRASVWAWRLPKLRRDTLNAPIVDAWNERNTK